MRSTAALTGAGGCAEAVLLDTAVTGVTLALGEPVQRPVATRTGAPASLGIGGQADAAVRTRVVSSIRGGIS